MEASFMPLLLIALLLKVAVVWIGLFFGVINVCKVAPNKFFKNPVLLVLWESGLSFAIMAIHFFIAFQSIHTLERGETVWSNIPVALMFFVVFVVTTYSAVNMSNKENHSNPANR